MNWINIQTTILDSEEFVGSDPVARATWLCLFRYCAGQENGGVPDELHAWVDATFGPGHRLTLPMLPDPRARSLNLATAVACGVYEGLRQVGGISAPPGSV